MAGTFAQAQQDEEIKITSAPCPPLIPHSDGPRAGLREWEHKAWVCGPLWQPPRQPPLPSAITSARFTANVPGIVQLNSSKACSGTAPPDCQEPTQTHRWINNHPKATRAVQQPNSSGATPRVLEERAGKGREQPLHVLTAAFTEQPPPSMKPVTLCRKVTHVYPLKNAGFNGCMHPSCTL